MTHSTTVVVFGHGHLRPDAAAHSDRGVQYVSADYATGVNGTTGEFPNEHTLDTTQKKNG